MVEERDVTQIFEQLRNNYHQRLALTWGLRGLIVSLVLMIISAIITRFTAIILIQNIYLLLIFSGLPVISYICGYLWPVSTRTIIREADRRINFKERLLTLYEYLDKKSDNPFLEYLKYDVSRVFHLLQKRKIFPVKWMPEAGVIIILVMFFSVFIFWGANTPLSPGIRRPFPGPMNMEGQIPGLVDDNSEGEQQEETVTEEIHTEANLDLSHSETKIDREQTALNIEEDKQQINEDEMDAQESRNSLEDRLNDNSSREENSRTEQAVQSHMIESKSGSTSISEETSAEQRLEPEEDQEQSAAVEGKSATMDEKQRAGDRQSSPDRQEEAMQKQDDRPKSQSGEQKSQEIANQEQLTNDDNDDTGDDTDDNDITAAADDSYRQDINQKEETPDRQEQSSQKAHGQEDRDSNDTAGQETGQSAAGAQPGTSWQQEQDSETDELTEVNSNYYLNKVKSQLNNNQYLAEYLRDLTFPDNSKTDQISQERIIKYREELLNQFTNEEVPVLYRDLVRDYFKKITESGN